MNNMWLMNVYAFLFVMTFSVTGHAIVDGHEYPFTDGDEIQNASRAELFRQLAEELRCPKCQNQNLADSNAMIAGDLRRELYSQVKDGKNSDEIVDFMVNRYGEFVLYRPALNNKTLALWYGPFVLLGLAAVIFMSVLLARKMKANTEVAENPGASDAIIAEQNTQKNDALTADEQKRLDDLLNLGEVSPSASEHKDKKGQ